MQENLSSAGQTPTILTLRQLAARQAVWDVPALRRLVFFSVPRRNASGTLRPPNGFRHALVRVGRRVLVNEERFYECITSQQSGSGGAEMTS